MFSWSLAQLWRLTGKRENLKVRFNDWNHTIKYFTINGVSQDGKRFLGELDNGENLSFSTHSKGWQLYTPGQENVARAV